MARVEPKGNRFRIRYYADGRQQIWPETFPTRKEALRAARAIEVDKDRGSYRSPHRGRKTLEALFDEWLAESEARLERDPNARPAATTIAKWRGVWKAHVRAELGSTPIGKLTRGQLKRLRDGIASPFQANEALKLLHVLLARAVDDEELAENVAHRIPRRDEPSRRDPLVLTPEQIDTLADAVGGRWRALVYVNCYGGLRLSEGLAIELEQIDWLHRRILIDRAIVEAAGVTHRKMTKTGSKGARWVHLPGFVVDELAAHVQRHGIKSGLLFRSRAGGPVRRTKFGANVWRPALDTLKLEGFTAREMRHTGASLVLAAGGDLKDVADRLGHTTTTMADRLYAQLYDTRRRELADRLGTLRGVKEA